MKKLLVIETSPNGNHSTSRQVTQSLVAHLKKKEDYVVIVRDLNHSPLPHVTGDTVQAYFTPSEAHTEKHRAVIRPSDEAVDELLAADTIVIGTPMWNFGLPSVLKAWVDHVIRAGRTFSFAGGKLEGLVRGKKVYLVISSGSVFSEGPFSAYDQIVPYFKTALGFIGMTDLTVIRAEGTNDPTKLSQVLAKANEQIAAI
jgi:FMN-dependent NADH-azoreductase